MAISISVAADVQAKTKTKTVPYDVSEQLLTPEEMAACLDAWLVEAPEDAAGIARARGDIARAKGMSSADTHAWGHTWGPTRGVRSCNIATPTRGVRSCNIATKHDRIAPNRVTIIRREITHSQAHPRRASTVIHRARWLRCRLRVMSCRETILLWPRRRRATRAVHFQKDGCHAPQ